MSSPTGLALQSGYALQDRRAAAIGQLFRRGCPRNCSSERLANRHWETGKAGQAR